MFFFEDDIEVAEDYFGFALRALNTLEAAKDSVLKKSVIGISLNTPPLNEISTPRSWWNARESLSKIGSTSNVHLFALPNSWGAVYFAPAWRAFLNYYHWRRAIPEAAFPRSPQIVPDAASNDWVRSWKRYLIEFAFLHGKTLIHPALDGNASFSTHHREAGQHTNLKTAEAEDLDRLSTDRTFTVPLTTLKACDLNVPALEAIPVVDLYHQLAIRGLASILLQGLWTEQLLRPYGLQIEHACLLDNLGIDKSLPDCQGLVISFEDSKEKSLLERLTILQLAMWHGRVLDKASLVIPPAFNDIFATTMADTEIHPASIAYSDKPIISANELFTIPVRNGILREELVRSLFGECKNGRLHFCTDQAVTIDPKKPIALPPLVPSVRSKVDSLKGNIKKESKGYTCFHKRTHSASLDAECFANAECEAHRSRCRFAATRASKSAIPLMSSLLNIDVNANEPILEFDETVENAFMANLITCLEADHYIPDPLSAWSKWLSRQRGDPVL